MRSYLILSNLRLLGKPTRPSPQLSIQRDIGLCRIQLTDLETRTDQGSHCFACNENAILQVLVLGSTSTEAHDEY